MCVCVLYEFVQIFFPKNFHCKINENVIINAIIYNIHIQ